MVTRHGVQNQPRWGAQLKQYFPGICRADVNSDIPCRQPCRSDAGTPICQLPLALTTAAYSTPLMVTVTCVPAAVGTGAGHGRSCCCSMALIIIARNGIYRRRGSALMLISRSPLPVLP